MIIFKKAEALTSYLKKHKDGKRTIGFVPTMGALHDGHLSLISKCKNDTDIAVCSIFVNPTQFNDEKDFQKYPVTIPEDILQLEKLDCDILFLPTVQEIYPRGVASTKHYEIGKLENSLEGKFRPGHFQGVCQVVDRLLNVVLPDKLYLGQKDFQQCKVIQRLIEILDLPIELIIGNTMREPSGLAMSSRNMRLSAEEKEQALTIYSALQFINDSYKAVPFNKLKKESALYLKKHGFSIVDYVEIADAKTLDITDTYDSSKTYVALIAAFLGEIRLIDNLLLNNGN
jgi:pantoate--beta-alanine ligase